MILLDLFAENFLPVPKPDTGDEDTADGVHPNARGHELLAKRIVQYISENVKKDVRI